MIEYLLLVTSPIYITILLILIYCILDNISYQIIHDRQVKAHKKAEEMLVGKNNSKEITQRCLDIIDSIEYNRR